MPKESVKELDTNSSSSNAAQHFRTIRRYTRNRQKCLPDSVSEWKLKHSNKLNIYYQKKYLSTPVDVILKTGNVKELSYLQKKYIKVLQSYLHFDAVHKRNADKVPIHRFYDDYMKPELEKILRTVLAKPPDGDKIHEESKENTSIVERVKFCVEDFIYELLIFLRRTLHPHSNVTEGMYSSLFRSFAAMCHLRPRNGDEYPSCFKGLMGADVSSKPNYRLCTRHMSNVEDKDPYTVVSVVKLEKSDMDDENELFRKRHKQSCNRCSSSSEDEPLRKKTKRSVKMESSSSMSSEDESRSLKSALELDLGSAVLGQHAGELLLDIPKMQYTTIKIPGMIVKDTKVYFTLLDMSGDHYYKLCKRMTLDKDRDVATIYYSKPLDILIEEERNILVESFMRLNNIDTELPHVIDKSEIF
ncbi:Hypothetical predicted protein [Mytilus galloprovincialis]|uniref:Uncharacterized protein n=1 Tax=Mytilus galloprovincialis TaxID=29158 RepID=A0A8B6D9X1_MYTGA|nr:Hypothetical predicted protein [Mytilus galloprovincialis]